MQISKNADSPRRHRWHPFQPTDYKNVDFSAFSMRLRNGAFDSKFTQSTVLHQDTMKFESSRLAQLLHHPSP
jgi:hypothetical protein